MPRPLIDRLDDLVSHSFGRLPILELWFRLATLPVAGALILVDVLIYKYDPDDLLKGR